MNCARILSFVLVCAFSPEVLGQIEALENQFWNCAAAAQDTNGVIYTSPPGDGRGWFAKWENGRRSTTGSDFGPGAKLAWLQRGQDGGVYGLWDCDDKTVSVSFAGLNHFNAAPRVQGPSSQVKIFDDARGKIWVTDGGLNIYRYNGSKRSLIHTVTSDEMSGGGDLARSLPLSIIEDGRGRMWFWSDYLMDDARTGAVAGAFIFDGQTLVHHASFPGVAGRQFSALCKINADTFWLAAKDAGIYSVNMDTMAGEAIKPPQRGAFRTVQKIFTDGDDVYVIAGGPEDVTLEGTIGALWRRRKGVWMAVIAGLDGEWRPRAACDRDWLATAEGLWLGASGSGGWFLPKAGGVRPVDWHVNAPLQSIDRWLRLPDGRIGAIEFNHGGISIRPASLLAPPPASKIQIVGASRLFVETESGVIFGFLKSASGLSVWDGARWQEHSFPKDFSWNAEPQLAPDSLGRLWWIHLSYSEHDPTPSWIFDPGAGGFEKFNSYQSALEAQRPRAAKFSLAKDPFFAPKFSKDGQICFEDQYWKLHYFNGHTWREWEKHSIGPLRGQLLHPFFDAKGILTVLLEPGPYQFTEITGWRAASGLAPPRIAEDSSNSPMPLPLMAFTPDSITTDRLGTRWFTHEGQLYRAGYGLVSPWFKPNEPQPFVDGRRAQQVLLDKNGGAFIRTDAAGGSQYLFLPSGMPDGKTSLQVDDSAEGVMMRLAAPGLPGARFSWRQDDGPWSEATASKVIALEIAEKGTHRVQVLAIGKGMRTCGAPAEAAFVVRSDPAQQIQKLIVQLDDPEFSRREIAVAALARVPGLARPALEKALEKRGEAERWWLEAALREVENAAPKPTPDGD